MAKNSLHFFHRIIYQLKRRYGFDIGVYRTTETTDLKTGRKTVNRSMFMVKKAIILPNAIFRDFGAAGLAALNTDLQLGGLLDSNQRTIIIDMTALPKGFVFNPNDYVIFKSKRYNIVKIAAMEVVDFLQLDIKRTEGEPKFEIFQICMRQKLAMTDSSSIGG